MEIIITMLTGLVLFLTIEYTNSFDVIKITQGKVFKLNKSKYRCTQVEKLEYVKVKESK